jgi:hypothetical protein
MGPPQTSVVGSAAARLAADSTGLPAAVGFTAAVVVEVASMAVVVDPSAEAAGTAAAVVVAEGVITN